MRKLFSALWTALAVFASAVAPASAQVAPETINQMKTFYRGEYYPLGSGHTSMDGWFSLFGRPSEYRLNDGTTWSSGPWVYGNSAWASFKQVTRIGKQLTFTFTPMDDDGVLFEHLDYGNYEGHATQGILGFPTAYAIVARVGSQHGVIEGYAPILSNEPLVCGIPCFHYYSAPVGQKVFFRQKFWLPYTTFTEDLFQRVFDYEISGSVRFTRMLGDAAPAQSK